MTLTEQDATVIRRMLLDAAEWLDTHGWCQGLGGRTAEGHYTVPEFDNRKLDSMCLGGAIYAAAGHYGVRHDYASLGMRCRANEACLHCAALQLLTDAIPPAGRPIHTWNDTPERTKDEVVTLLRDVAAELDQGETS